MRTKSSGIRGLYLHCKHPGVYVSKGSNTESDNEDAGYDKDIKKPTVIKRSSKIVCTCYVNAKRTAEGAWYISDYDLKHNHDISIVKNVYSEYRVQPTEINNRIIQLFESGFNASTVFSILKSDGVTNIIKKDIENKYYHYFKSELGRSMFDYIKELEDKNYLMAYRTDALNSIESVFFCHESSILKARRMPESILIDATYKLDSHKLIFVNIVGTSNLTGGKATRTSRSNGEDTLQTFEIAGAWISGESQDSYHWAVKTLKDTIWCDEYKM